MSMLIGYTRGSMMDHNFDLQEDALLKVGYEEIIRDKILGAKSNRLGLEKVKTILCKGDTLVVWRLDRLGRSLKDLINWITYLKKMESLL